MSNNMRPIHSGEILKDELKELELTPTSFAKLILVPPNRITSILKGQRSVTVDTALRFAKYFGTAPEFWLNLQSSFDPKTARKKHGKEIEIGVVDLGEVSFCTLLNRFFGSFSL